MQSLHPPLVGFHMKLIAVMWAEGWGMGAEAGEGEIPRQVKMTINSIFNLFYNRVTLN